MAVFKLQIEVELQFDTNEEVTLDPAAVAEALQGLAMDYPVFVGGARTYLEGEFNVLGAQNVDTLPQLPREPRCVITGLAICDGDVWAAADLFDAGDWWVVNANARVHETGVIGLEWVQAPSHYSKSIHINPGCLWFERRGVFVIHKTCATLNQAAQDYINRK